MSDQPESLVLVYLRRLDAKVDSLGDRLVEVVHRLGSADVGLAALRRNVAHLDGTVAHMGVRMDRMETRLDRIERRLDLSEAL